MNDLRISLACCCITYGSHCAFVRGVGLVLYGKRLVADSSDSRPFTHNKPEQVSVGLEPAPQPPPVRPEQCCREKERSSDQRSLFLLPVGAAKSKVSDAFTDSHKQTDVLEENFYL